MGNEYIVGPRCCNVDGREVELDKKQRKILFCIVLFIFVCGTILGVCTKVFVFAIGCFILAILFALLGWFALFYSCED